MPRMVVVAVVSFRDFGCRESPLENGMIKDWRD